MTLETQNLDDRSYADLVEEGLSMIPRYARDWTNHNASDPGIMLVELLAYYTEILVYRLNRISRESRIRFLRLLTGDVASSFEAKSNAEIDAELILAVQSLATPQRAVVRDDYEFLARQAVAAWYSHPGTIRAFCAIGADLTSENSYDRNDYLGHVSIVVVPHERLQDRDLDSLLTNVHEQVAPKCLVTTRLHIVGPCFLWLSLGLRIRTEPQANVERLREIVTQRLQDFFSPYEIADQYRDAWPFGRYVYLSELRALISAIPDVFRVTDLRVLQLSSKKETLATDRMAVGIQLGVRSTIGKTSNWGVMLGSVVTG